MIGRTFVCRFHDFYVHRRCDDLIFYLFREKTVSLADRDTNEIIIYEHGSKPVSVWKNPNFGWPTKHVEHVLQMFV